MFECTFLIISIKEKTSLWYAHSSYREWNLPCNESQFTTTSGLEGESLDVLTMRIWALHWRAHRSVCHVPPLAKVIPPDMEQKHCLDPSCGELSGGRHLPKGMSSDSLITVQLEAWQATVKVARDGFRPAEGCAVHGARMGAGNVHGSFPIVCIPFAD